LNFESIILLYRSLILFYTINVIIMQIISVVIFVLGASVATLALPTQSGGCPGGYAEGSEIERGRLVYVCQGGQVVPKGCIAEDLSHIAVGANYDNAHYRRACVASGQELTFEPTGCIQNGKEHKASESWEDGSSFYTCKANPTEPLLKAVSEGCVDSGKRVPLKEKVTKDDGVFVCEETANGGHKLVQGGCVKGGKAYADKDSFDDGKFWFTCTRIGREKYVVRPTGCISNGKRLNDGDRYAENDVSFECTIDDDKTGVRAMACIQNDGGSTIERKLGCTWVEGTAPQQFEYRCDHDEAANTATKVQVRCNYNVGNGVYIIEPGCYRVIEKGAFGCIKHGAGLKFQSFQGDDAEKSASSAGLHAC
jgi:hypothetical protein